MTLRNFRVVLSAERTTLKFLRVKIISMNSVQDHWKSQAHRGKANGRRLSSKAASQSVPLITKNSARAPSAGDYTVRSSLQRIPASCGPAKHLVLCGPQNLSKARGSRHMRPELLPTATAQLVGSRHRVRTAFRIPKTERTQHKLLGEKLLGSNLCPLPCA